jgi:hypothetical protein
VFFGSPSGLAFEGELMLFSQEMVVISLNGTILKRIFLRAFVEFGHGVGVGQLLRGGGTVLNGAVLGRIKRVKTARLVLCLTLRRQIPHEYFF